jgi:hypothetical protein
MIRIQLPAAEAARLDQAFRQETDVRFKDRSQIVRLANRNRPHREAARDQAGRPRTVQRWPNAYRDRGLDGLRPRKASGRPPGIPAELAEVVLGKVLRRRAPHNRLSDTLADRQGPVRNTVRYFPTVRARVKALLNGRKKRPAHQTASPGL